MIAPVKPTRRTSRDSGRKRTGAAERGGFRPPWRGRPRIRRKGLYRWLGNLVLIAFVAPALLILLYRVVPPPATPLMLIRAVEGRGIDKQWVPLDEISPYLQRAVIASEDAKFCTHHGFDWDAVDNAIERLQKKHRRVLGASTISMQTSKNLFLWPSRTFIRKGLEAYLTVWLEALLPKRRILELYLNEIEWGPGIYGAEAASQRYFGIGAARLSPHQAALLAAVLPNPIDWRPDRPGPWTQDRAFTIEARLGGVTLGKGTPCP
ncbi:MAG: monofunctional biosynthetic peptidoglycan transglycosylase [Parvibaculum sp.]|uniref:monofunctional biosynthetic peptidoglycan transglycosylase n=1 Tax=Parvibaculum sp. TaxID=2024848 RepID=UPI002851D2F4|nr:monofunctional biosynthetic peptidoglycan transglycosylase [Parvibaculum sp.]MDR3499328.1 monofunctional biosynthetic peptidoglycan transglycosylase [Parvibaculum sp.]